MVPTTGPDLNVYASPPELDRYRAMATAVATQAESDGYIYGRPKGGCQCRCARGSGECGPVIASGYASPYYSTREACSGVAKGIFFFRFGNQ